MAMSLTQDDLKSFELMLEKALQPLRQDVQGLHQSLYGQDGSNGLNGRVKDLEHDTKAISASLNKIWGVGLVAGLLVGAVEWFRK